ncbi:O-antigen ligase family protein [bacterium]|nr:O-antigen ligase family protein [bacterium]
MSQRNVIYRIICAIIFVSTFFIEAEIFGLPFALIFVLILILSLIGQSKNNSWISPDIRSKRLLGYFLLAVIFTYVIRLKLADDIAKNYYEASGSIPTFLYFRIVINGIGLIVFAYLSFCCGYAIRGDLKLARKVTKVIINVCAILALVNLISWFLETNGSIARYNFTLLINKSYGVNITWSILGFLLLLPELNKWPVKSFNILKIILFGLSILIIVSRQGQLMLVLGVLLYFNEGMYAARLRVVVGGVLSLLAANLLIVPILDINIIESWKSLGSFWSEDIQSRFVTIVEALRIFGDHPIMGVGYGMYSGFNTSTIMVERTEVSLGSSHNGLAAILAETGLIGLVITALLISSILKNVSTRVIIKRKNKFFRAIKVYITVQLLSIFVSNYALLPPPSEHTSWGIVSVSWLLIGLSASFNFRKKQIGCIS